MLFRRMYPCSSGRCAHALQEDVPMLFGKTEITPDSASLCFIVYNVGSKYTTFKTRFDGKILLA